MDHSINFLSVVTLYGVLIGFILVLFLFFVKSDKSWANIYLGVLIFAIMFYLLPVFIYLVGLLETFPHIIRVYLPFGFLVGPIIYFYVRSCTQKGFRLTPNLYWHFVPFILNVLYTLPFYSLSGAEKIISFHDFFNSGFSAEPLLIDIGKRIHAIIYFFVSTRIVLRYKGHLTNAASYIDAGFYRWLLFFCSSLLIPLLTFAFFASSAMNYFDIQFSLGLSYLSITFFFVAVLASALLKPEIFHTFPHQMLLPESTEDKTQKYESSNLQEAQKEKFVEKLISYVEKNKPFQEPELTLAQLAEQVDIPSHYLSQVINEKLNCSFLDFINSYRIEDAKMKLVDTAFSHYTIIAIAFEVGFNSKSAFYSAFKKHTGNTPSAYRKALKAS